jgi:hypothetical protein
MIFAILFIIAFLIGLLIYLYNRNWVLGVSIPMVLFTISTLADEEARGAWGFTLTFGLPLVFVASLLGAYVVELRSADPADADPADAEQTSGQEPDGPN